MRWSYKTVHFGLKKESLLGSAFIDESEIEITLNEYGRGGWELVSMLEMRDGVIAVFKQPLDMQCSRSGLQLEEEAGQAVVISAISSEQAPPAYEPEQAEDLYEEKDEIHPDIKNYPEDREEVSGEQEEAEEPDSGIGSIRIE